MTCGGYRTAEAFMATLQRKWAIFAITLFFVLSLGSANEWHFPSCVVVDPDSGQCLSIFMRHWDGYPSAVGGGDLVHHEWIWFLNHVYDYNDVSSSSCSIRKKPISHSTFENATWTRDGFTTCSEDDVTIFNSWWGYECEGHCVENDNCRRYGFYLAHHLWNNCTWSAVDDRPDYDIKVP